MNRGRSSHFFIKYNIDIGYYKMRLRELLEGLNKEQKRWLYTNLSNLNYDRHKWAKIFNNKYRIYLPYNGVSDINDSPSYTHVEYVLEKLGKLDGDPWVIEDYIKGIAVRKAPSVIAIDKIVTITNRPDLLDKWKSCVQKYETNQDNMIEVNNLLKELLELGYNLIPSTEDTFMKGLFTRYSEKRISIGKLLEQAIKHNLADNNITKYYAKDPYRTGAKTKLNIVISRHPEDIGGMSTNRRWESCMNLDTGVNKKYVPIDIAEGTLVAYLINENDTKIDNPIARILIKPFINIKDKSVALGVQDKMYPSNAPAAFGEHVSNWADSINDSHELNGIFKLSDKVYSDDQGKNVKRIGDMEEDDTYIETLKPDSLMIIVRKIAEAVENYLEERFNEMESEDEGYYEWLAQDYADEEGDIDWDRVQDDEVTYLDYNTDLHGWRNLVLSFFSDRLLLDDIYNYAKSYLSEYEEIATVEKTLPDIISELAGVWYRYHARRTDMSKVLQFLQGIEMKRDSNGDWEVKY